ncbi:hypothetical protein GH714_043944 [Hevea brasiliensis]|uniref:Uncharacterized protein n=1 Tax=Hevea brasiliensis TaxID=3981 RepID=A0A6A6K2K3_HEVBR|nr:hypothetical protein GH714_043944 [Hevea brasiliensis]
MYSIPTHYGTSCATATLQIRETSPKAVAPLDALVAKIPTWFRNKSSNQMPSAAGCSTKVSGDTYAQRLSGSEGDGAYSNEGLSHTDLPQPLVTFLPTYCLPRQWLRNQGIGALRLPFSMVTSVKSLVLLGLRKSSPLRQIPILK